jgi:hypothetical protein
MVDRWWYSGAANEGVDPAGNECGLDNGGDCDAAAEAAGGERLAFEQSGGEDGLWLDVVGQSGSF